MSRANKLILTVSRKLGLSQPTVISNILETQYWIKRSYGPPSPSFIKRAVLVRNGLSNCTWVETGTYRGTTTRELAKHATRVISIEPDPVLCAKARLKLQQLNNVTVVHGLSEEILPEILSTIEGNVCFWLDGHFSGGVTFKGPQDTPVREELSVIASFISRFDNVVVLVDDIRMFEQGGPTLTYPSVESLVEWANLNHLKWKIEHDIFVASNEVPKQII